MYCQCRMVVVWLLCTDYWIGEILEWAKQSISCLKLSPCSKVRDGSSSLRYTEVIEIEGENR